MMRVADDGYSLSEQDDKCRQYCASRGYDVVVNLEDVYSGAELTLRPKMSESRDRIGKQKVDIEVVAGKHGEMKLLRLAPDDAMYCDPTIDTVQ